MSTNAAQSLETDFHNDHGVYFAAKLGQPNFGKFVLLGGNLGMSMFFKLVFAFLISRTASPLALVAVKNQTVNPFAWS